MTGSLRLTIVKLAVFAAVTLSLTGLLAAVIGNIQPFTKFYTVKAEFGDATGLLNTDVVKVAGVKSTHFEGPARIFDREEDAFKAILRGEINPNYHVENRPHAPTSPVNGSPPGRRPPRGERHAHQVPHGNQRRRLRRHP